MPPPFRQPNAADDEPSTYKNLLDNALSVFARQGAAFAPYAGITIDLKPADIDAGGNLICKKGHNFIENDVVSFSTNGTLVGGVSRGTDYHVISSGLTHDKFKISATRGGAEIDITDGGAGIHQCVLKPAMKVRLSPGLIVVSGTTPASVGTQVSLTLTAPVTNPRNDILVIDKTAGTLLIIAGTEAASPLDPAVTTGKIAIARINLTVGMTEIVNTDLIDIRAAIMSAPLPPGASEDVKGIIEIADTAEQDAKTNDNKAMTPLKTANMMKKPPPIGQTTANKIKGTILMATTSIKSAAGAVITEFSTDGTLAGNSNTAVPTEQAVKNYVDSHMKVLQVVMTTFGSVITSTARIPEDTTIPQSNEGVQVMTQAITPVSALSKLIIEVSVYVNNLIGIYSDYDGSFEGYVEGSSVIMALFKGSARSAIAATPGRYLGYIESSTTVASRIYKVRLGITAKGTLYFNGKTPGRHDRLISVFEGIPKSSIKITEVLS